MEVSSEDYPTISIVTVAPQSVIVPAGGRAVVMVGGGTSPATSVEVTASGIFPQVKHSEMLDVAAKTISASILVFNSADQIIQQERASVSLPAKEAVIANKTYGSACHLYAPVNRPRAQIQTAMARIADAGCTMVRASFPWLFIHPTSAGLGAAEATRVTNYLTDAAAEGLSVFAPLGALTAPAYATDLIEGQSNGIDYGRPRQADLNDYIDAVWTEWGTDILAIAIENEPNHSSHYREPTDLVDGQDMLNTALGLAGATWTNVFGELAFADHVYLEDCFQAGLTSADYDVLSFHPYNINFDFPGYSTGLMRDPRIPWPINDNLSQYVQYGASQGTANILAKLTEHGQGAKPLWVTEFGFPASTSTPGLTLSEAHAGEWTAEEIDQLARWDTVDVIMPYILDRQESADAFSWWLNYGSFTSSDTERPKHAPVKSKILALA